MRSLAFRTLLRAPVTFALAAALASCGGSVSSPTGGNTHGPPVQQPPSPPLAERLCAFDASPGSAKGVLALHIGSQVLVVRSDGSQVVVRDSLPDPGPGLSQGTFLAGTTRLYVGILYPRPLPGMPTGSDATYQLLLDAAGTAMWERDEDQTLLINAALNDRGDLAAFVQQLGPSTVVSNDLLEVSAGGDAHTFPTWRPLAATAADGSVLVESIPSTAVEPMKLGWLQPDGSFHAASGSWTNALAVERLVVDGPRLVYLDADGASLVVETQAERRAIPLPHTIVPPVNGRVPNLLVAGGWATVGDLRVALDAATVETIAAPSNGLRAFTPGCGVPQLALEEDGSVLEALRNDVLGGMYRSSDLGKSWTPIGETVSDVSELGVTVSHGTYLVQGEVTYCGDDAWQPAPPGKGAALTGDSLQIVRPSLQRERVLTADVFPPVVSNDGLCVAFADADMGGGYSLKVWDLQTDRTITVLAPSASYVAFQAQWMEPSRSTALRW